MSLVILGHVYMDSYKLNMDKDNLRVIGDILQDLFEYNPEALYSEEVNPLNITTIGQEMSKKYKHRLSTIRKVYKENISHSSLILGNWIDILYLYK